MVRSSSKTGVSCCRRQSGGDAHRRQCGAGRRSKGKRGSKRRGSKKKRGGRRTKYTLRGGACDATSVDLGHTLDLNDQIRGRAAVVRQRGGDAHGYLRYDCKQADWGAECR